MNGQQSGLPCIKCDSSDAMTVYPKGDGFCFSCESYFSKGAMEEYAPFDGIDVKAPERPVEKRSPTPTHPTGSPTNVPSRGLQGPSLAFYGVTYDSDKDRMEFPVFSEGKQTGWKLKDLEGKTFGATGSIKNPDLFGQHLMGDGGKLLIITEGEEDCMSAYQMLKAAGKNYKVVSLPNGANLSAVKKQLNWLEKFETITLNLDNDEKGQQCAKDIAELLTPGKVKVMSLPNSSSGMVKGDLIKDANDMLLKDKNAANNYLKAVWNAKPYRPDGVISMDRIEDYLWKEEETESVPYPWKGLNSMLYGMREREITTWTAGTGIGKSAVIREIEHHILRTTKDSIGVLALEESVGRTGWGVIAVEANLPLAIREERKRLGYGVGDKDVLKWIDKSGMRDRMHVLDHWGSTDADNLINKVRYMIKGLDCKWIILDHLAIVVSGMDSNDDERKTIDRIMTNLRGLCEETGAGLHLVSHLRRVDGNRSHEQGLEIGLSHLRGSQAIAQLSDIVVAMERNQQADDPKEANLTRLRVLKNRYAGLTGLATNLAYDRETGRLKEIFNVDTYLAPSVEETGC